MSRSTAQPRGECQAKPPHRAVWAVWAGGSTAPSGGEGPAGGTRQETEKVAVTWIRTLAHTLASTHSGTRAHTGDAHAHRHPQRSRPRTLARTHAHQHGGPLSVGPGWGSDAWALGRGWVPGRIAATGPPHACSVQRARPPRKHRPSPRRQARREGGLRPRRVGCRARRSVRPAAVEQREARRRQTWRKAALRPRPADGGRPRVGVTSRRRCRFRAHDLRRRRRPAVRGSALRVPAPSASVNGLVHRRSSASPARLRPGPRHPALPRSFAGTSVNYSN